MPTPPPPSGAGGAAEAGGAAAASSLPELSVDEMKAKLLSSLQEGGKLGTLRAGIRHAMFGGLVGATDSSAPSLLSPTEAAAAAAAAPGGSVRRAKKPLSQLAVDVVVLEYLETAGYHFSQSVFVAESNLSATPADNRMRTCDAHAVLCDPCTTHPAVAPLLGCVSALRRRGACDAEVQCGEQDVQRLDYKLQLIDEDYHHRLAERQGGGGGGGGCRPSVNERLRRYQEELDAGFEKRVADEVERVRRTELSEMRLREHARYEAALAERAREADARERREQHELQLEKYAVQARQRELEVMTAQLERERAEHASAGQGRESALATLQRESVEAEELRVRMEGEAALLRAELAAARELATELQVRQRRYAEELARVQAEAERASETRAEEWSRYQREKNAVLEEYQHKILEGDLTLQNALEEARREAARREAGRKREHEAEMARARTQAVRERDDVRREAEAEVRAGLAREIEELKERQAGFCKAMVEAQMELDAKRSRVQTVSQR